MIVTVVLGKFTLLGGVMDVQIVDVRMCGFLMCG